MEEKENREKRGFEFRRRVSKRRSRCRGCSRLNFLQNLQKSAKSCKKFRSRKESKEISSSEEAFERGGSMQRLVESQFSAKFAKICTKFRDRKESKEISSSEEAFERGGLDTEAVRGSIFLQCLQVSARKQEIENLNEDRIGPTIANMNA